MRFIKKILERGTITIPSDVREAVGVEEGDIVEFQILRIVKRGPDGADLLDAAPPAAVKPAASKSDSPVLGRDA